MSTSSAMVDQLRAPAPAERPGPTRGRRLGLAGVVVGIAAFFVAVPPIELRTWVPTAVLALVAIGLGVAALREGERRPGWYAVVAGVLGLVLGVLATRARVSDLEAVVSWGALGASTLRYATPLLFAALGGLLSERSGVVNIGLEGMILMGAFFGALGSDKLGNWALGILCGVAAGMALAAVLAVFAVSLQADQIVVGTGLNFLALGLTGYLYVDIYGEQGTPDTLSRVPNVDLPIGSVPFFGDAFGQLNLLVWVALAATVLVWLFVFRTARGLRLRSVGENPRAAETVGISVYATRYAAVIASGGMAALGGAFLSIGFVGSFTQNMSAGRGFIALAALIFGAWKPYGALAATLLFGFSSALAQRLPAFSDSAATLFQALPYVLTLIVVAGVIGRSVAPAADGVPYKKSA